MTKRKTVRAGKGAMGHYMFYCALDFKNMLAREARQASDGNGKAPSLARYLEAILVALGPEGRREMFAKATLRRVRDTIAKLDKIAAAQ